MILNNQHLSRRGVLGAAAALAGTAAALAVAPGALAAPDAAAASVASAPSALSRPDRVFLRRGLRHGAWITQEGLDGGWAPTPATFRASGFTDPTWYDAPLWRSELMARLPEYGWSATKGPKGSHLKGLSQDAPLPAAILSADQQARVDGLFTFCMGDEENYSADLQAELTALFTKMRTEAPDALLHTNQWAGQWNDTQMKTYMKSSEPDLLTFDNYYFAWGKSYKGGSVTDCYNSLGMYRNWAMLGNDLTGANPIQFGQYTMGFRSGQATWMEGVDYIISESQQFLPSYATWTFGGRWLDLFRWQHGDTALLSRADGSTTIQFDRYQQLNRQLRALSPYLTRLRSKSVSIVLGRNAAGSNAQPNLPVFTKGIDPETRIAAIGAENIGGANGGLAGDVLVGTFRPIPGMSSAEAGEFQDSRTPAFMVTNALVVPNTDPRQEAGTGGNGADTRQRITLTLDLDAEVNPGRLRTVNATTGRTEVVQVTRTEGKGWEATLELNGGTGQLLWWDLK